uniref:IlGF domain-containing protein n=1 Tax=Trichobilharzia regenti TaxID=157069 RepID=A0AA85IXA3_TRIRE|nr:unnamed protein product [Trichobilharzia regenti]
MFNKPWLSIISSLVFYIMFLPSSESAALLRWFCTIINITLLCNDAAKATVGQLEAVFNGGGGGETAALECYGECDKKQNEVNFECC